AVSRRPGDHRRPEVRDQPVLDLRARVAGGDPLRDEALHLLGDRRVGLIERHVTRRADDLALELALRRMLLARRRGRSGEQERRKRYEESASWMHWSSVSRVTAPGTCATTRPRLSAQNVSGTP